MDVIHASRARSLAEAPALSVIPAGSALIWPGARARAAIRPRRGRYRGQVPAVVVMRLTDGPVLLVNHMFPSGPGVMTDGSLMVGAV